MAVVTPPFPPVLHLNAVSKRFPGVKALDQVSLTLYPGEVTALIGENGAGKSTLVKILTGIYTPDEGEIVVAGQSHRFSAPTEAWEAGITAIHQETVMFDELTVAENVFMGHMPLNDWGMVDWPLIRRETAALLTRIEADFSPDTKLKHLGVAAKHLVEIARALSHDARIVIMDEPTAALSAREIDDLFRIVDQLKGEGRAVLFISHKFDEIFRIADRWTCLRDGRPVGDGLIREVQEADLVKLMVGRAVDQIFPKRAVTAGAEILRVEGLGNPTEFDDLTFTLHKGEILGLYGLVGAGRSEAMQALFGLSRPTRARIWIDGQPVIIHSPHEAIKAGLAYVPEDRQVQGAVLPLGIRENLTLASLAGNARHGFLSTERELETTRQFGTRLSVKAAHWDQSLGELSGGNQQKVVIAKWLATHPRILILDEPTKGIDVGSKAAVHDFMSELAAEGLAIILVSSELPEVMGMADRILVLHEGRMVRSFSRAEATAEAIVTAATGGNTLRRTGTHA